MKIRHAKKYVIDIFNKDDLREILISEHNRAHLSLRENVKQILDNYYFPRIYTGNGKINNFNLQNQDRDDIKEPLNFHKNTEALVCDN